MDQLHNCRTKKSHLYENYNLWHSKLYLHVIHEEVCRSVKFCNSGKCNACIFKYKEVIYWIWVQRKKRRNKLIQSISLHLAGRPNQWSQNFLKLIPRHIVQSNKPIIFYMLNSYSQRVLAYIFNVYRPGRMTQNNCRFLAHYPTAPCRRLLVTYNARIAHLSLSSTYAQVRLL